MSGCESYRVIEEKQWGPSASSSKWRPPRFVPSQARYPERTLMVAHDLAIAIYQAATVAGKQSAGVDGVNITPRIDSVPAGHRG